MKKIGRQDGYFNEVVQEVSGKRHRDQETSGKGTREMSLIKKMEPNIQIKDWIYVKMWVIVLYRGSTGEGRIDGEVYKTMNE